MLWNARPLSLSGRQRGACDAWGVEPDRDSGPRCLVGYRKQRLRRPDELLLHQE